MRNLESAREELEAEFEEPMRDILQGFFLQGESAHSTAKILEVDPGSLRTWATKNGIIHHAPESTRHRMPNTPEASKKISRAMRERAPQVELNGKKGSFADWAQELGIKRNTLCQRIRRGMSAEDALQSRILTKADAGRLGMRKRWK